MHTVTAQRSLALRPGQSSFTELHSLEMRRAIKSHNSEVVCSLISRGFDVTLPLTHDKWNAFLFLAQEGFCALVRSLVEAGADVDYQDEDGFTALMVAADRGNLEMVKTLVSLGCNRALTYDGKHTAWHLALQSERAAVAEFLGS